MQENVIKLECCNGIAIVRMEEREGKNTFTRVYVEGILKVFRQIEEAGEAIKCVIVTGYDKYFSCGGTKEELYGLHDSYAINNGESGSFIDGGFYDIFLNCRVPVISAMQGHALGGGLAFGCFADFVVMAEECIYTANFMNYGFTPGMGATFSIPYVFGELLGWELLFTGKNYFGHELKQRGISAKIVTQKEVFNEAMGIALTLVNKPLLSLETLKDNKINSIRPLVKEAVDKELQMHKVTFGQEEVKERIKNNLF